MQLFLVLLYTYATWLANFSILFAATAAHCAACTSLAKVEMFAIYCYFTMTAMDMKVDIELTMRTGRVCRLHWKREGWKGENEEVGRGCAVGGAGKSILM